MKIKDGFMTRKIGGKIVAVPVGVATASFNGMINLNETGEFIWKCLEKDTTEDEVAQKVAEHYEIDNETASSAVAKFVNTLRQNGLLDE